MVKPNDIVRLSTLGRQILHRSPTLGGTGKVISIDPFKPDHVSVQWENRGKPVLMARRYIEVLYDFRNTIEDYEA